MLSRYPDVLDAAERAARRGTTRQPGANRRASRTGPEDYWPVHDLPVVTTKMLNDPLTR